MTNATKEVPEGYKSATRNLPPFLTLGEVGQYIEGVLLGVRRRVEQVKDKKGKVKSEKESYFYTFKLVSPAKGDDGTANHRPVSFGVGDTITLPSKGNLIRAMQRAVLEASGTSCEGVKTEDWPEPDYQAAYGLQFFVRRAPDATIKQGPYKGKPCSMFEVAWKRVG